MQKGSRKKTNGITKALKQFQEDWLNLNEIYIPPYSGSRRWYPGIKEEQARQRAYRDEREKRKRLAYLKRKSWVETKRTADGMCARLTDEGKLEVIKRTLHEKPKLRGSKRCLVLFDIPEKVRYGRDAFRNFLKKVGFTMLQRSVWMSDRDVADEIRSFVQKTKIQKWVCVFVGVEK